MKYLINRLFQWAYHKELTHISNTVREPALSALKPIEHCNIRLGMLDVLKELDLPLK